MVDCLLDRNHITGTNTGALYSTGNNNSNCTDTSAGYAIVGLQNVNITGCMLSNTQSSSIMHITSQYSGAACRAIHSQASARVIVTNGDFFDVKATGRGGMIHSSINFCYPN